jgi:cellulose synthase/poly-beta-1,6-N-acetylglucosamine synthase-like glycosyltransferase
VEALGVKVIVVHPERPAAAIGRNAGWQAAHAPIILFLDGDTILHPDFVKNALPYFKDPQVAIVCGQLRERYPEISIYQRILDLDWMFPLGKVDFCGGLALTRRQVLEDVGGFNAQLIAGEEPEMCQRIRARGYIILHINEQMALHDLAIRTWSQYWRRATRTGHALAEVSTLLRDTTTPLWQHESRKNWLNAGALIGLFGVGFVLTLFLKSLIPLSLSVLIYLLLSVRTAIKARWKSDNWVTLLLYGLHAQFHHLPIALGQLSYFYHRWRGKQRRLIEYK